MATAPNSRPATPEDQPGDEPPELLVKLQERKKRHAERGVPARVAVVVVAVVLVLLGIAMSGPGIPGPGIVVILVGLSFLALDFERAERLLGRAIVWADRAKNRAEEASPRQKKLSAALGVLAIAGFVAAAILWDIPLLAV